MVQKNLKMTCFGATFFKHCEFVDFDSWQKYYISTTQALTKTRSSWSTKRLPCLGEKAVVVCGEGREPQCSAGAGQVAQVKEGSNNKQLKTAICSKYIQP